MLLFILYINDIKLCLKFCKYNLFADNTMLYNIARDINKLFIDNISYDAATLHADLELTQIK